MPRRRRKGAATGDNVPEKELEEAEPKDLRQLQEEWRRRMRNMFPNMLLTVYFVPPIYFNRADYGKTEFAGKSLFVKRQVSEDGKSGPEPLAASMPVFRSDIHEDTAQRFVLFSFEKLFERQKRTAFVISQLNFKNYANKLREPTTPELVKSKDLGKDHDRGDFDLLIVLKDNGILIGEIKSLGLNGRVEDIVLVKRIQKAMQQLEKEETFVQKTMGDLAIPHLVVLKILILPYVRRERLVRVLQNDEELSEAFCKCLGSKPATRAADLCLCADNMPDSNPQDDKNPNPICRLETWFENCLTHMGNHALEDINYETIVARLVGPVTTVEVHCPFSPRLEIRTSAEAVSETGERLSKLTLTRDQLETLSKEGEPEMKKVCLVGPPGTGKTLMLVLVGLKWLRDGNNVIVLSTRPEAQPISLQIKHQIETTFREDQDDTTSSPTVRHLYFDLRCSEGDKNASKAVEKISSLAQDQKLFILMDEAWFSSSEAGPRLKRIIKNLTQKCSDLHIWTGTLRTVKIPECFQRVPLRLPLRCTPVIQQEVSAGLDEKIDGYTSDKWLPAPCDGPGIIKLKHGGAGHTGKWPVECSECGSLVAKELSQLRVGVNGKDSPSEEAGAGTESPPPLKFSDVFILTRSSLLQSDTASSVCGFIAGLRGEPYKIPVKVLSMDSEKFQEDAEEVVTGKLDKVILADIEAVHGLERKIVVCLEGRKPGDERVDPKTLEKLGRLYAVSRCISQLVFVSV